VKITNDSAAAFDWAGVKMAISIIIPTRNGASTLAELLAVLSLQTVQAAEILVVDSCSTDETVDIARQYGAEVSIITTESFDHGGTRTDIARLARGEYLVFFTQDAIPATKDALARLLFPLISQPAAAVCYGRQLPQKDATWAAASLRLFNYPEQSSVRRFADREMHGLKTVFVSNSFAAYRKSALEEVGFFKNGLIFGEDTCTVGRLLEKGYLSIYASEAKVYHSHNYSWQEEFRRSFDIGVLHTAERWLLDTYGKAEGVGMNFVRSQLTTLWHEKQYVHMADILIRSAFKLAGYTSGRWHHRIPAGLIPHLSMHKGWWSRNNGGTGCDSAD
jgi:rhamnosyltransferase